MTLASRLTALATAIGTDIKALNTKYNAATVTMDGWHLIGPGQSVGFANSWTAYDSSVYYRKDPFGRVYLRGSLNGGASGSIAFTLPVGYRPVVAGQNRIRAISIGNQTATGQWEAQVNVAPNGDVSIFFTGSSATSYVSLDQIEFDSGTVSELALLTAGTIPTTLTMDPTHIVGAAGEPAFTAASGWTSYDGGAVYQVPGFKKDPFGRVMLFGSAKGGASGTVVFTLPEGYRPTKAVRYNPRGSGQGNTPWAQINIAVNGQVTAYGDATTALISFDGVEFETNSVSSIIIAGQVQAQPEVITTLNWNTALTTGFYRSTNDVMLDTINGPGDTLNPPAQAGIVIAHANGAIVQRVWELDTKTSWTRYLNQVGEWSTWVADLVKTRLDTELMIGGATPVDGDERYFQTAAMKTLGVMWKFRYNASSASSYKWEFVGGGYLSAQASAGVSYTTSATPYSYGAALAVPQVTFPLSGDFRARWQCGGQIGTSQPGDLRVAMFVNAVAKGTAFGSTSSGLPNFAMPGEVPVTGVLEGQVADLRLTASIASANVSVWERGISVQPIRVAL